MVAEDEVEAAVVAHFGRLLAVLCRAIVFLDGRMGWVVRSTYLMMVCAVLFLPESEVAGAWEKIVVVSSVSLYPSFLCDMVDFGRGAMGEGGF